MGTSAGQHATQYPSSRPESDLTLNSTEEKKVVSSKEDLLRRDGVTPGLYIPPSNLLLS